MLIDELFCIHISLTVNMCEQSMAVQNLRRENFFAVFLNTKVGTCMKSS